MAPLTIAGSISVSGSSVSGAVHVAGSNCFDRLTIVVLTGTLTNGNISLTSTAVNGQVITLTGSITEKIGFPDSLVGTYAINGGCADGDQGNSTGYNVISLAGYWAGSLTGAGGQTIHWDTQLNQNRPTAEGSFGLSGAFTFDGCFFVRHGHVGNVSLCQLHPGHGCGPGHQHRQWQNGFRGNDGTLRFD
jgi:hypothetical protein